MSVPSAVSEPADGRLRAVALDGLSGVGKSTVGRGVAHARSWRYLDTGASYRAVTLAALQAGVVAPGASHLGEPAAAAVTAVAATALTELDISLQPDRPGLRLAGCDRTAEIRSAAVTSAVSAVSAVPAVRALLVRWQRELAVTAAGIVVEGRDIGAVVLPDAPLKLWLTADVAARTARRAADDEALGASLEQVRRSVDRRDALDTGRGAGPVRPAPDAVVLDTSDLDLVGVVAAVLSLMDARGLNGPDVG